MALAQVLGMVLLTDVAFSGRLLWELKQRARAVHQSGADLHRAVTSAPFVVEGQMDQRLDHFNGRNTNAFPQRFVVNEAYWRQPGGPVFLYIGGEGALSKFSVLAGHHVAMAKEHGALVVALEHRFYGSSINPGGLEVVGLQHLSSQQALSDLAAFRAFIGRKYGLAESSVWICFGGSYAGALSAWFRGKFPHLVYGAVASSGPVLARLDFSAYNKVVGRGLADERVGGSDKCLHSIQKAFASLTAVLLGENEARVVEDFACCDAPKVPEDRLELVQSLADIIMGGVQYNEEGVTLTIAQICAIMTNRSQARSHEEEAYDRLIELAKIYRGMAGEPCLDVSHERAILSLNQTASASSGYRQWYYQTCTEFGFYQTCEDASCPFSRLLPLRFHTQLCPLLFGIPERAVPVNIAFTNQYYGGNRPRTRRVLYVNGDIDPWTELSVVRNGTGADQDRAVLIRGTAHCADMNGARARDRPSLRQAREEIERHVAMWLKNAARERTV